VKKLLLLVGLFVFLTPSLGSADDISDFEIEGMSVGDSLLDYFSEEEIKKNITPNYYKIHKFTIVDFNKLSFFEVYDHVQINYLRNDDQYIIHALGGDTIFHDSIEKCYKIKDQIVAELNEVFKDTKPTDLGTVKLLYDTTGKSIVTTIHFVLNSNDVAMVQCYDWSEKIRIRDYLRVGLLTKEFIDFLDFEAY
jgi:hypothetical protein